MAIHIFRHQGGAEIEIAVEELIIAGWTGRDQDALERHIRELEAIGVARPERTPIYYRVAADLVTSDNFIQVVGGHSSGEVEFVLFGGGDGMWVGVGSDHTDRQLESHDVTLSKQVCAKAVGPELWRYDEVAKHWDELILRSYARIDGRHVRYQEGAVGHIRPPGDLIRGYQGGGATLPAGSAMFGGTLAVLGDVRAAAEFEIELFDPIRERSLKHAYRIDVLPG